jgi:hypothetical protein
MPASGAAFTTEGQTKPVQIWAAKSLIGRSNDISCPRIRVRSRKKGLMGGRIVNGDAPFPTETIPSGGKAMVIHLEREKLINTQQMEVAVHGPDGATHLILCTGVADLGSGEHKSYTFFVGPMLSQRQFVGAIASSAISTIQSTDRQPSTVSYDAEQGTNLVLVTANYDQEARQVKIRVEVTSLADIGKLAITYNVSILAELPNY